MYFPDAHYRVCLRRVQGLSAIGDLAQIVFLGSVPVRDQHEGLQACLAAMDPDTVRYITVGFGVVVPRRLRGSPEH